MAGRSASCYGTSGLGKGGIIFTGINISDSFIYYYYCEIKGMGLTSRLQLMLQCQPCGKE